MSIQHATTTKTETPSATIETWSPPAEQDDQALAALLVALAHGLDASLAAITQALPALESAPGSANTTAQRYAVEHIAREAQEARAGLAALVTMGELRRGPGQLRTASVEVGDLLMGIIPQWKSRAPRHVFELALPGEMPPILADEQLIERALEAIIEHAVKMASRGGTIRVDVRPRHDEVVVSVRQRARAVASCQLDHLFAPFARLDGCEDVMVGGGLGLPLARAIVEAHGGRIWAELPEGQPGMTVYATWPLEPPRAAASRAAASRALPVADAVRPAASAPERLPLTRGQQVVLLAMADTRLGNYVRANLEAEQFRAVVTTEPAEVFHLLELEEPDLLLLDAELAELGDLERLPRLLASAHAPVIVLARRHDPIECAHALNQGASDYLARPFSVEELVARVRATLRVSATASRAEVAEPIFSNGDLTIDIAQRLVTVGDRPVALSKTEFKLLRALARHAGMVLSHETLLERVWGPAYAHEVEFVWVYIRRLRRKIEPDPAHPRYIQTVPGVGYRLVRA